MPGDKPERSVLAAAGRCDRHPLFLQVFRTLDSRRCVYNQLEGIKVKGRHGVYAFSKLRVRLDRGKIDLPGLQQVDVLSGTTGFENIKSDAGMSLVEDLGNSRRQLE